MTIGVLALQGDFDKHSQLLAKLDIEFLLVKTAEELDRCNGLIIPGGESTTFALLLQKHGLWTKLYEFAKSHPVFGTCAGLIILAKHVTGETLKTFGLIDIEVERNAYGRQIDSFIDTIHGQLDGKKFEFEGVFIRAPKIKTLGPEVIALAKHKSDVVLAESDNILIATFHPELTDDTRIHNYFCHKVASFIKIT